MVIRIEGNPDDIAALIAIIQGQQKPVDMDKAIDQVSDALRSAIIGQTSRTSGKRKQ